MFWIGRKLILSGAVAAVGAIGLVLAPTPARAFWVGGPHVGIYFGFPRVFVGPPVVYAAPPVAYAPPVVYAAPRAPIWVPAHWEGAYWVPGHWS